MDRMARIAYVLMASAIVGTIYQAGHGLLAIALAVLLAAAWVTR